MNGNVIAFKKANLRCALSLAVNRLVPDLIFFIHPFDVLAFSDKMDKADMVGVVVIKADAAFQRGRDPALTIVIAVHGNDRIRLRDHDLTFQFSRRQDQGDHIIVKAVVFLHREFL